MRQAQDGRTASTLAGKEVFDVVVSDIRMPGLDGLGLLRGLREANADASVILTTAFGTVEAALEAIKDGAYDYVSKPVRLDELLLTVGGRWSVGGSSARGGVGGIASRPVSPQQHRRRESAHDRGLQDHRAGRPEPSPVLITGESGTGKELVARAIHSAARAPPGLRGRQLRARFAESLLESELFGHERGAFTGAIASAARALRAADGGTVFLDEIGDIGPTPCRPSSCACSRSGRCEPVGSDDAVRVDVRVVAATNRGPGGRGRARTLPRGPVLPAQRRARSSSRRCASGARTFPLLAAFLPPKIHRGQREEHRRILPGRFWLAWRHTRGPATSGNWKMP